MIPDSASLALFVVATLVLLATPGPAVLFIVARSVDQGRRAGLVSTLGVGAGTLFHVGAASVGLSALLASSALAFNVVRYVGAVYLVYLGIRRLMEEDAPPDRPGPRRGLGRIFRQGVVVNLLNPKTALFFLAFLPQFVDPARGPVHMQVLFLGSLFVLLGVLSDGVWALAAGTAGHWMKRSRRLRRIQRYLTGGVFVALGLGAALAGERHQP